MTHQSKIWSCPRGCGYHIADGPVPDGDVPTDVLISEHMEEHGPAVVELTDELARVLTAVAASTDGQVQDVDDAAVSVLVSLGLVHEDDGGLFVEHAGREALAAREVAREAAARKQLADSYAAAVAELHAIADAIDTIPVEGLAELRMDVRISTSYRRAENNAAKVATVDAVAAALLVNRAETKRLGSSDTWQRKAEGRRGPVEVEVAAFVEDPSAREREAAEQARVDEVERLRAEVAKLKADASGRPQSTIEQAEAAAPLSDHPGGAA